MMILILGGGESRNIVESGPGNTCHFCEMEGEVRGSYRSRQVQVESEQAVRLARRYPFSMALNLSDDIVSRFRYSIEWRTRQPP